MRSAPGESVGPGAAFRIVQAFLANPRDHVDGHYHVLTLSEHGFTLERRTLGQRATLLTDNFSALDGATQSESVLDVGLCAPLIGPLLNRLIPLAKFPEAMGRVWIAHRIEEVGQFEAFLPELYASTGNSPGNDPVP